uniref:Uncharacterized protein n=1 Tax=Oryza sativa subsp. japonica TaxID=39947 RepID=Q6K7B7_ORYSJ|nr:hypothetical protein [Oryza sativa Japonica Group]
MTHRRSDRRQGGGQTGGVRAVRPTAATGATSDFGGSTDRSTSVRPTFFRRSDRCIYFGQTAIHRFEDKKNSALATPPLLSPHPQQHRLFPLIWARSINSRDLIR